MRRCLTILALIMSAAPALAGVLTAELDKTVGPLDEPFMLRLTVSGDHDAEPQLPDIANLRISAAGTSSNFSIINGNASRSTEYQFMLQPLKQGTYEIPSISLQVDGKLEQTVPLKFRVENVGANGGGEPALAFVERELSSTKAYVGEPVVAKIRIYFREKLAQVQDASESSSDIRSFKSEEPRTYSAEKNGVPYRVHEITEVLVPGKAGQLTLPPVVLEAQVPVTSRRRRGGSSIFDDFFGGGLGARYKRKVLRSESAVINVEPIPTKDRPKIFSGLVGSFEVAADLSRQAVQTGETVTLTVTVEGKGLVDSLDNLSLNLPPKIKVYADKPVGEQAIDDQTGFRSRKIFKFALVPTAPGTYELPPVQLNIFVPELGSFVTLEAKIPTVTAAGKEEDLGVSDGRARQQQVEKLGEDLINMHRGSELESQHALVRSDYYVLSALSSLPTLALFVGWFWRRRRRYVDPRWERKKQRSRAFSQLDRALANAATCSQLFSALRVYFGHVLDTKGSTLAKRDALNELGRRGLPAEMGEKLNTVWDELVRVEYGGIEVGTERLDALKAQTLEVAREVEKVC